MLFNCHCFPPFAPLHICSVCGLTLSPFPQQDPRTISQRDTTVDRKILQHLQRVIKIYNVPFFFFFLILLNKQRVGRKLTVTDVLHLHELRLAGMLFNCELLTCCLQKPAAAGANGSGEKRLSSPRADELVVSTETPHSSLSDSFY